MKTKHFLLTNAFIILSSLTFSSCDQFLSKDQNLKDENLENKGISLIQYDDDEMNTAITNAKATFQDFENEIKNPDGKYFAVKVGILYTGGKEHIWVVDVIEENGKYFGRVDNEPEYTDKVKLNDLIEIPTDIISDWMILEGDKLIGGGYTLKLIRNRMSPEERAAFDQESQINFS